MKILSIGNSFSEDAHRYLHGIAKSAGESFKTVNLMIGGCSLRTHYVNAVDDRKKYHIEFNGQGTGFFTSIKEALLSDEWDIVTVQQVSSKAPYYDTYQPYLNYIADYVRTYVPKAKIYVHQTWAYEQNSKRLCEELGYTDYTQMLSDIKKSYNAAANDIKADGIIPSGELFDGLLKNGIEKVHRDTFHARLGLGRYALGMLWFAVLTGKNIKTNTFSEFDEPVSDAQIEIIKNTIDKLIF